MDTRRLALIDVRRAMREASENPLLATDISLEVAIDLVLRAGQRSLLSAIDFEVGEYRAVSIFRIDGDELRRVVALRLDPLEEQVEGRGRLRGARVRLTLASHPSFPQAGAR